MEPSQQTIRVQGGILFVDQRAVAPDAVVSMPASAVVQLALGAWEAGARAMERSATTEVQTIFGRTEADDLVSVKVSGPSGPLTATAAAAIAISAARD